MVKKEFYKKSPELAVKFVTSLPEVIPKTYIVIKMPLLRNDMQSGDSLDDLD